MRHRVSRANHSVRFGENSMEQADKHAQNPGRERILARIRAALREAAPQHQARSTPGAIFAAVPDALGRFQQECAGNNTECLVVPDMGAGTAAVATVLGSLPAGEIFVQDAPSLRSMTSMWHEGRTVRWSSEGAPTESSSATISLAETLVAQTGSIFVSAACGGRGGAHRGGGPRAASSRSPSGLRSAARERCASEEFLSVPDHRFEPHSRHRKNNRHGSTWPSPISRRAGPRFLLAATGRVEARTRHERAQSHVASPRTRSSYVWRLRAMRKRKPSTRISGGLRRAL